jgi:hypothetical protein
MLLIDGNFDAKVFFFASDEHLEKIPTLLAVNSTNL